jgi:very-short-patch-repair endonuclease
LRNRNLAGHKFRCQAPIGPYILNFCCFSVNLIIELDGGQHAESVSDNQRTRWLEAKGFRELRFWNHDVLANTAGVLEMIRIALRDSG